MFTAWGSGVTKNRDGTITVKVRIVDAGNRFIKSEEYSGFDLPSIKETIAADLARLASATDDTALQAAVVGVELGHV